MDKKYIVETIERLINGRDFNWCPENVAELSAVDRYLQNVVIRVINIYNKYKKEEAGEADYLAVLREFMISFKAELEINHIDLKKCSRFSIFKIPSTEKFSATYDVPKYIENKEFVEKSFVDIYTEIEKETSMYSLYMNGYMRQLTGYTSFKSIEQKLCVYGALNTPESYTSLICLPTGGGKSLVTQVLAYEKKGLSIVVVPTVSLALDQERSAKENIKIAKENEIFCYYNGSNNIDQIKDAIQKGQARLLFISPEALIKNETFKEIIIQANSLRYIKNLIVDEAHMVVAWGDLFRVDYQCLGPWRKELLKSNPSLRTFLMSATFTDETVNILKGIFSNSQKWLEVRCDSLRKEPRYICLPVENFNEKKKRVLELVDLMPKPMILYVNAPYEADMWTEFLYQAGYYNVRTFTGHTKSKKRREIIREWSENQFEIMVATSAFGVGVDKADVRCVIHLYVPESPDAYYQELGRGVRDGLPCLSIMCINKDDLNTAYKNIGKVLTLDKLWGRWWSMLRSNDSTWFGSNITVFTSTKPKYNRTDYFEEGNETDEKWNINVLLLLARNNLIRITSVELDSENRYIFTINVMEEAILENTDKAKIIFEKIREKESNKAIHSFHLLKESIEKKGKLCWSSMFYETYPLVSEYCSGCDQHDNVECDEMNRFPLLVNISEPVKPIVDEMRDFFSDTNEALIISDSSREELVERYRPDLVVSEYNDGYEKILNPGIMYVNFKEYSELKKRDNRFYVSGIIMVIYSKNSMKAMSEYRMIKKYGLRDSKIIHVTEKDFMISNELEKFISYDIDGRILS